ncbi:sirohydrochlorin cobaltochelatase [Clostridium chrysemydis]|uniref:sirohydrochlorin cobaltochelatase n=1 Tax=Clostridium chrysemydis TaxID=2665504 RepID=UPI003F353948
MKKAILVVSFGTSYKSALENSIERIEEDIKDSFKDYDIFRAFTSHMIIKKLRGIGEEILTPEEALEEIHKMGYKEVIMQPLHIIPGEEYDYIVNVKDRFKENFSDIKVGRPILYFQGTKEAPDDYSLFINSIKEIIKDKNTVLFGHGTSHYATSAYGCIQAVLQDEGLDNVYVGTVEGYPSLENVINRIKKDNVKDIMLLPLMVVCGDHVLNDMASDEEDSWKTILEKEGFNVSLFLKGLGEIEGFRKLYIDRVKDCINNRYLNVGKTKKGMKNEKNNNLIKL